MFFSSQDPFPETMDDSIPIDTIFPPKLRWQIIEQSSDCIKVLDLNGRLLYMNRGGQKTMEIDDFSVYHLANWPIFWSGEGLQAAQEALAHARHGQETTFEAVTPTAKGTPRWWEVTVSPVLDTTSQVSHILAISRDITERKRVEEERENLLLVSQKATEQAEHERARLQTVLDNLTDAFLMFDEDWHYTYINPQAIPYTGLPWQNLLGKKVWEMFPNLVGSIYYQHYHHAMEKQEPVAFETFNKTLNAWFEIHAYPIPGGLAVYFRNISARKQAEEERTRLLKKAEHAQREAEEALQIRNDFLSSVSHDLKTPLTVMKGTVQILQRRLKQADAPHILDRLKVLDASINKMQGMIEDLLTVAQLKAGQHLDLDMRPLNLYPLIERIVGEQQETTEHHRLHLSTSSKELPVQGDAIRLDRVVTNLLTNAIKYSPDGGSITLDITIEEELDQHWITMRFQDQGIGIPEADQPFLFRPFYRASNVRGHIPGTGVGLASVAQVIHEHGGTIAISSQQGQGTCVLVRLPANKKLFLVSKKPLN